MLWCSAEEVVVDCSTSLPSSSSSKLGAVPELVTTAITITCLSRVGGWRHRADYDRSSRFSISVDALRSRRGGGGDGLPDDRGWIAWEEGGGEAAANESKLVVTKSDVGWGGNGK